MAKSEARQEFLTDIMVTAAEGGINYWAGITEYVWDVPYSERHVTFIESEEDETVSFTVTPDMLASALAKFNRGEAVFIEQCGKGQLKLANSTNGEDGDYDAGDADCLLQIAAFGEVIYG